MKKFALLTGITGLIVLIISIYFNLPSVIRNLIQFGINQNYIKFVYLFYGILTVVIVIYFLYYYIEDKIEFNLIMRTTSVVLIMLSILIYSLFLLQSVFIFANLIIKEELLKEEIVIDSNQELINNYSQYIKTYSIFKDKYQFIISSYPKAGEAVKSLDYKSKDGALVLDNTRAERDQLLNLLTNKVMANPNPNYSNKQASQEIIYDKLQKASMFEPQLRDFYKCELLDITRELNRGNKRAATNRYISLWMSIDKMLEEENARLLDEMLITAFSGILKNYYLENHKMMSSDINGNLSTVLLSIEKKIDRSFQNSLKSEYFNAKEILGLYKSNIKWPFFNYNRSINEIYRKYKLAIDTCEKPFKEIEMNTLTKANSEEPIYYIFANPVGTLLNVLHSPQDWIIKQKEIYKSSLRAMLFIINRGTKREIPIDNLTGKSFVVKEYTDHYEVFTELNTNGVPEFVHKVSK